MAIRRGTKATGLGGIGPGSGRIRYESEEQAMLWARIQNLLPAWARELMWASPIGERFPAHVAARLRRMGSLEAGIPDLTVAIPVGMHHGLFIELKRVRGGRVSPDQVERHRALRNAGYRVEVCKGADAAFAVLEAWVRAAMAAREWERPDNDDGSDGL